MGKTSIETAPAGTERWKAELDRMCKEKGMSTQVAVTRAIFGKLNSGEAPSEKEEKNLNSEVNRLLNGHEDTWRRWTTGERQSHLDALAELLGLEREELEQLRVDCKQGRPTPVENAWHASFPQLMAADMWIDVPIQHSSHNSVEDLARALEKSWWPEDAETLRSISPPAPHQKSSPNNRTRRLWILGPAGSGKRSLARELQKRLVGQGSVHRKGEPRRVKLVTEHPRTGWRAMLKDTLHPMIIVSERLPREALTPRRPGPLVPSALEKHQEPEQVHCAPWSTKEVERLIECLLSQRSVPLDWRINLRDFQEKFGAAGLMGQFQTPRHLISAIGLVASGKVSKPGVPLIDAFLAHNWRDTADCLPVDARIDESDLDKLLVRWFLECPQLPWYQAPRSSVLNWLRAITEGTASVQELVKSGQQLARQAKSSSGAERNRALDALEQLLQHPPTETILDMFVAAGLLNLESELDQVSIADATHARFRIARALARAKTLELIPLPSHRLLDADMIPMVQALALFGLDGSTFARWLEACPDTVQGEAQQLLVVFAAACPQDSDTAAPSSTSLPDPAIVKAWATTLWWLLNKPYVDNCFGTQVDHNTEKELTRALQTLSERYREVLPRLVTLEKDMPDMEPLERLKMFVHPAVQRVVAWWNGPRPGSVTTSGPWILAAMLSGNQPASKIMTDLLAENDPPTIRRSEQRSRLLELAPWQVLPMYMNPLNMRSAGDEQFQKLERAYEWMAERGDLVARAVLSGREGIELSRLRRITPLARLRWTARNEHFDLDDWWAFQATLEELWARSEGKDRNEKWLPAQAELEEILDAVDRMQGCGPQFADAWIRLTLAPFGPIFLRLLGDPPEGTPQFRSLALKMAERLKQVDLFEAIVAWPERWAAGLRVTEMDGCGIQFESTMDLEGPFKELSSAFQILRRPIKLSGKMREQLMVIQRAPLGSPAAVHAPHDLEKDSETIPLWHHFMTLHQGPGGNEPPDFLRIVDGWCEKFDRRAEEAAVILHRLGRPDALRQRWRHGSGWPFRPEFVEQLCRLQLLTLALELPLSALVRVPFPLELERQWSDEHPPAAEIKPRAHCELIALGRDNLPPHWGTAVDTLRSLATFPAPDAWPPELLGWLKLLEPEFSLKSGSRSSRLIPKYRSRRGNSSSVAEVTPAECHCWPVHELLAKAVGAEWGALRVSARAFELLKTLEDQLLLETWLEQLDGSGARRTTQIPAVDGLEQWVLAVPKLLDCAWNLLRRLPDSPVRQAVLRLGAPSKYGEKRTSRPWYFEEADLVSPAKRAQTLLVPPDSPSAIPALRRAIQDLRGISPVPVRTFAWYALQLHTFEPWCTEVFEALNLWLSQSAPFDGGEDWRSPAGDEETLVTREGGVQSLIRLLHRLCQEVQPMRQQKEPPWLKNKVTKLWESACQLGFQDKTPGARSRDDAGNPLDSRLEHEPSLSMGLEIHSWDMDSLPEPCNTLADILERLSLSSVLVNTFDHPPASRPDDDCPNGLSRPILFQRWLIRWKCPTLSESELACFAPEDLRTSAFVQYYRQELEPLSARVERLKDEASTEFMSREIPAGPGRWSPAIRPNHYPLLELLHVAPEVAFELLNTLRVAHPARHRLLLVLLTDLDHGLRESSLSVWLGREITGDTLARVRLLLRELSEELAG